MTAGRGRPPYWLDTLVLPASRPEGIHERDWDVLLARRSGLSQQQIADRLGITANRVAQIARARRLQARPDPIPVVLISAARSDPHLLGVPFVAKPFDHRDLVTVVARTLAGSG